MSQLLTIVVPVFRSEDTLVELHDRIAAAVEPIEDLDFELLFVDDASPDGSWARIEAMASTDPRVGGLRLGRNGGQIRAVCAGYAAARGDVLMAMDADLEHPPEAIPRMVEAYRRGHDLVVAQRVGRPTEGVRRRGSSAIGLVARAVGLPTTDVGSSFVLGSPRMGAELRRIVEETGRQMVGPTVFEAACSPTLVEVELPTEAPTAYPLRAVLGLAAEYVAAEAVPRLGRRLLLAAAGLALLGIHGPWRTRALRSAGATAAVGVIGLVAPWGFRRDRDQQLYEVVARIDPASGTRHEAG